MSDEVIVGRLTGLHAGDGAARPLPASMHEASPTPSGPPLDYVRMRCAGCGDPFRPGDKAKDPQSYPRIGLPRGVTYDPQKHNRGTVCVDCLLAIRYERYQEEERIEIEKLEVAEEKVRNGALSEDTIRREVEAGRMSATEGLYEFMALMKTRGR